MKGKSHLLLIVGFDTGDPYLDSLLHASMTDTGTVYHGNDPAIEMKVKKTRASGNMVMGCDREPIINQCRKSKAFPDDLKYAAVLC